MNNIKQVLDALQLAKTHIEWCWDHIEANTRLKRGGSSLILREITNALEEGRRTNLLLGYSCNCPNGTYDIKHSTECFEKQIAQLSKALMSIAETPLNVSGRVREFARKQAQLTITDQLE